MKYNHKLLWKVLLILGVICLFGIGLSFFANYKIEKEIKKAVPNLSYEDFEVHLIGGKLEMHKPEYQSDTYLFSAAEAKLVGFGYFDYLFHKKIDFSEFLVDQPDVMLLNQEEKQKGDSSRTNFDKIITINTIYFSNGNLKIKQKDTVADKLFFNFQEFKMHGFVINPKSIKNDIPFNYDSVYVASDSLRLDMNPEHFLTVGHLQIQKDDIRVEKLNIIPKYDKAEFDAHISEEKDRMQVSIDSLHFQNFSWELKNDSLSLASTKLDIQNGDLQVYRNKLLPDDLSIKDMYSKQIREAPVKMDFNEIEVKNSSIVYEEKKRKDNPPGKVQFTHVNANILYLSNMHMNSDDFKTTQIHVEAHFMDAAPLQVDWSFNAANLEDKYHISGKLGSISSEALNAIFTPEMNVAAEGNINSMAFNYYGNNDSATGEIRMNYEDFKINILKKDGSEKNKFFSAILNFFVHNDSANGNVVHKDLKVTRDKTKSFWNYLWISVREGALKSFF